MVEIEEVTTVISRFDPEKDKKARYESYKVPYKKGMKVLDLIMHVQRNHDHTLAYRWNCRQGMCGSCGVEVNGKPKLACKCDIDKDTVVIEPMKSFPTVKDLVSDVDEVFVKMDKLKPYFVPIPNESRKKGFWTMFDYEFHELEEAKRCIECFLCYDVCHVIRNHKDLEFAGPVNFVKAMGLERHPRDHENRIQELIDGGIWHCNMTRCCSETCPEGIRITEDFITYGKERIVSERGFLARIWKWLKSLRGEKK